MYDLFDFTLWLIETLAMLIVILIIGIILIVTLPVWIVPFLIYKVLNLWKN